MTRLALLLFASVAAPALAQSQPAEIVVTGQSLALPPGERAYDVATVDRLRIEETPSNRLEDVLRDVAGFAQFRRSDATSAQPTSQGATLRGLGGNASSRALMLLDGVPFSDPFGGWISYAAIDPSRLGAVRVVRGGGSGAAGPGALAGTIELTSANAGQLTPIWADLAYGSRDSIDAHAGVSAKAGGGFAFLSASYQRGDGFVPIVREDRGPVDVASPYRQFSLSARAVFPVGGDAELQASGLVFTDHRTRGTAFTPNDTKGEDASIRLVGRGRWGYEALLYVQDRQFEAGFATINATRTTVAPTLDQYSVPATGLGGRLEVRPPVGSHVQLRIGADARDVTGETDEFYQYTGLPAQPSPCGRRDADRGRVRRGERRTRARPYPHRRRPDRSLVDHRRLPPPELTRQQCGADGHHALSDRNGTRPTGRAGVAWRPANGPRALRGAAYLGWRLPTLNELYRPYRVGQDSYLQNPLLRPERLRGLDGGADFDPLPNLRLSATGFTNRLEDAVGNVTQSIAASGARTLMRQNLPAIVSNGAELDARLVYGDWRLSASYAYTDARVSGAGASAALDGKRRRRPPAPGLDHARLDAEPAHPLRHAALCRPAIRGRPEHAPAAWRADDGRLRPPAAGHRFALELRGQNLANERVEEAFRATMSWNGRRPARCGWAKLRRPLIVHRRGT